jgi:homospermidine synthase
MGDAIKYAAFPGRIVILGFGSIGQGFLPLLLRHVDIPVDRITIITGDERGLEEAKKYAIRFIVSPATRDNYKEILEPHLEAGDFLVDLSIDVSSVALIHFCHERGVLYLNTVIEAWAGFYTDPSLPPELRTNYALREAAIALKKPFSGGPTAVLTHGANPGLVSHFVKQALLNIATDTGLEFTPPSLQRDWAELAARLNIKTIHIAERDWQVTDKAKQPGEFVNTWSIDGLISESCQPAELGWGAHEKYFPEDGAEHDFGSGAAIYLKRPGGATRVRSWTPMAGPVQGFLITHNESISITDYLTLRQGGRVNYRPTVHYSYHPCNAAVLSLLELEEKNWQPPKLQRLIVDDIVSGIDELGVLLMGHKMSAYWYGSQLSIEEARRLVPNNNATSLQVCIAVLAGVIWAIENPKAGVREPDEIDFRRIMQISTPYLGKVAGFYSDWTPIKGRSILFEEDIDPDDPWQFKNFRIS